MNKKNAKLWSIFMRLTDLLKRSHVVQDFQASNQNCTADKFTFKFHTLLSLSLSREKHTPLLCVLVFVFFLNPQLSHLMWSTDSKLIKYRSQFMCQSNYSNEILFLLISTDLITELIRFESRMHTDEHSKLIIYKLCISIWISTRKTNTQCTLRFEISTERNYAALRKTITTFKACIYYEQIINHFMWIKCKPATKPWCIKS